MVLLWIEVFFVPAHSHSSSPSAPFVLILSSFFLILTTLLSQSALLKASDVKRELLGLRFGHFVRSANPLFLHTSLLLVPPLFPLIDFK